MSWTSPFFRRYFALSRSLPGLCALAFFTLAASTCAAATYYVSPSGSDNNGGTVLAPFQTIQHGINAAVSGDTVIVEDGTYTGSGNVDLDTGGNSITVASQSGAGKTVIDCGGTSTASHRAFYFHTKEANAILSGLTIENGFGGGAVSIAPGSTVTLADCTVSNNASDGVFSDGGTVTLTGCTVKNNTGAGVKADNTPSKLTLANCTISGNSGTGVLSASNGGVGTVACTGCTISGNGERGMVNGGVGMVSDCLITGNVGVGFSNGDVVTLTRCTLTQNGGGVDNLYTATLTDCSVSGNASDYVGGVDNFNTATLTDCKITGNAARLNNGGGVSTGDMATLTGCTITGNSAGLDGGGVYIDGAATLTNCEVSGNTAAAGGGLSDESDTSSASLTNCTIGQNVAAGGDGGGINNLDGVMTVSACLVAGNTAAAGSGGGVHVLDGTTAFTNCLFNANTAKNGGGGISFDEDQYAYYTTNTLTLRFCTLSGNGASGAGSQGGALEIGGTPLINVAQLADDVLWGNSAPNAGEIGIATANVPSAVVTDTDIQGGYSGKGNVAADPLFVNPGGDYHLQAGSPCIGAGTPITGVTTDLDGKTRANPPTLGCYEGAEGGTTANVLTHLLWSNPDGKAAFWNVDAAGNVTGVTGYGPYADGSSLWQATALATGPDGVSHILWNNPDGKAALWDVQTDGSVSAVAGFGPYTDGAAQNTWSAARLSVGPDNVRHLLWVNTDHKAAFWDVTPGGSVTSVTGYGPFFDGSSPWDAAGVSTGPDNVSHLLWHNADGKAAFWDVSDTDGSASALAGYGPFNDGNALWGALAVSTGPDNVSHLLWSNPDGKAAFWNVSDGDGSVGGVTGYGPYTDGSSLWSVTALATGPDDVSHLLWNNADGKAALWTLGASGSIGSVTGFGPYTDGSPQNTWSAVSVSTGP